MIEIPSPWRSLAYSGFWRFESFKRLDRSRLSGNSSYPEDIVHDCIRPLSSVGPFICTYSVVLDTV
jgi:hypothetical protein